MRYTGIFLVLTILFTACKKEEKVTDTSTACLSKPSDLDPAYAYEDLTRDYSIAFLPSYTYGGYIVFEGDFFIKKRYVNGDTITFTASYGPKQGQKSVYGPPLVNTEAAQVDITYNGQVQTLKKKKRLCTGGTIGYFYYTLERFDTTAINQGLGVVYLKEGEDFRQNIIADFPVDREDEVATIISTIQKK